MTEYVLLDRTTATKWSLTVVDGEVTRTVTTSAASTEPIFEDIVNPADNWTLFMDDDELSWENTVTAQDDDVTLEDTVDGISYKLVIADGEFGILEIAAVTFLAPVFLLTVSGAGQIAPGIGSLVPQIRKFINDPTVNGGCSQCGTLLWDIHENAVQIDSEHVKVGLNFDTDSGLPDDRFVRCARCGWINNQNRNSSQPEGSRTGWGITFPSFEVVPDEPLDN